MNHHVFAATFPGGLDKGDELVLVAVHTAVGNKSNKVKALTLGFLERSLESLDLLQGVVLDRLVNAGEVLVNDPTGTEVEVTHFGVAHLTFRKPHIQAGSGKKSLGILFLHLVVKGRGRKFDGVAIFLRGLFSTGVNTPAITDD